MPGSFPSLNDGDKWLNVNLCSFIQVCCPITNSFLSFSWEAHTHIQAKEERVIIVKWEWLHDGNKHLKRWFFVYSLCNLRLKFLYRNILNSRQFECLNMKVGIFLFTSFKLAIEISPFEFEKQSFEMLLSNPGRLQPEPRSRSNQWLLLAFGR